MTTERGRSKAEREFVSEAEEILDTMRGDLVELSEHADSPGREDPERVNALFRSAHSLKALAGMFRFDPIEGLTHRLEDVLDGLRLGRVALDGELLEVLDETVALFATLLDRVGDAEAIAGSQPATEALTARIAAVGVGTEAAAGELALDVDPDLLRALTEYEEHRLRENIRRGRHIALVEASFELSDFEAGLASLTEAIRAVGEVLSTLPAAGEGSTSQIRFSLLIASELDPLQLAPRLANPTAEVRSVWAGGPEAPGAGPAGEAAGDGPVQPAAGEIESLRSISDSVRVDIRKLDELMNLVGELVIQRGAIGELVSRLVGREDPHLVRDFAGAYKLFDRRLRELQAAVIDVRMVPLRQVFEKVSRVIRRLRRDLGKEVELEIRGGDTELDKLIVEALVDPLMHVVRNALDHAIEAPEERSAGGKPSAGRIAIEAFQRGSHVVVSVRDDGRGIDAAAVRRKAEALGIVAPDAVLSENEVLGLIFAPGFSTRAEVSETSGRGVGMDVVRENLAALGGVVEVDSVPGAGTTVSMTLPITLAIVQALIVGAREQRFAIPLNAVLETLVADPGAIQLSEGRELLNLRGVPLLLRRISDEFGLGPEGASERPFVIVVGIGDQRVGLVVDRLEGRQDAVIKPIRGPIRSLRGISGATDLGDGEPVLVLDAAALIDDSSRRREAA